jgi:hypothetical protein
MRSIGLPLFDTVSQGYTMLLLIADLFLGPHNQGGKIFYPLRTMVG